MNVEGLQQFRDAVDHAEHEFNIVYEKYCQAKNNLAEARRKLEEWNDGIQFKK